MPTIASFYGITISMYFTKSEHNPPHIHAYYERYEAVFSINTGEILEGKFPNKGTKLVQQFITENKERLREMWEKEEYAPLPIFD